MPREKYFSLRFSIPFLEEYLFKNKIKISHIEMDHSSRTAIVYFKGAGHETAEACKLVEVTERDLPKAVEYIKQCLQKD
jgi:hypothetical protein